MWNTAYTNLVDFSCLSKSGILNLFTIQYYTQYGKTSFSCHILKKIRCDIIYYPSALHIVFGITKFIWQSLQCVLIEGYL